VSKLTALFFFFTRPRVFYSQSRHSFVTSLKLKWSPSATELRETMKAMLKHAVGCPAAAFDPNAAADADVAAERERLYTRTVNYGLWLTGVGLLLTLLSSSSNVTLLGPIRCLGLAFVLGGVIFILAAVCRSWKERGAAVADLWRIADRRAAMASEPSSHVSSI
jgi:hypothetical protein